MLENAGCQWPITILTLLSSFIKKSDMGQHFQFLRSFFFTDIFFISVSFLNSATGAHSLNRGIDLKGIKTFTFYEINLICANDMANDHVTSDQSSTESSTRWSAESSGSTLRQTEVFVVR